MQSKISGDAEDLQKVGPYRLEEPLGSGGMGTVWRAWDDRLKRSVALKRILAGAAHKPNVRERFRREAEAEARLNHPSIVHIYDILETEDSDWIVMELVEGRTLRDVLDAGLLQPQDVARLGREIAEGLAEAHRHGIVHRDLKAGNVMITPNGHAKILDFGVAKQVQPEIQETTLSAPGTVVGTFHAMSPEQALGLPVDARSDLFSLGSLLYEMTTGEPPFRAETAAATLARVCSYQQIPVYQVRPEVPQELSGLIDRLLEKDPDWRFQSTADVVLALGAVESASSRGSAGSGSQPVIALEGSEQETQIDGAGLQAVKVARSTEALTGGRALRPWIASLPLLALLALAAGYAINSRLPAGSPHALYKEGSALLARYDQRGNLDNAIETFQKIVTDVEGYAPAYAGLAKAYWVKYQSESKDRMWLDKALPMAKRAVELDPYLAVGHVNLGLVLSSLGRHDEAVRELREALILEPRNADAHFGLAQVHQAQNKLEEAEAEYRKAIAVRPDRTFYDELGTLYLRIGRLDESVAASRKSVELAPDSYLGYRNLGAAYYMQGDLEAAATELQKALEIQPEASLYTNLGTIYFTQGFYPRSVAAFEKALEMPGGANNYQLWGNLADAYRWTPDRRDEAGGAYLRAIQLLRERLRAAPRDATLRSRLALYLAKSGDQAAARAEIQSLQDLVANDAYSQFRLAVAAEAAGDRDSALTMLARALRAGLSAEEVQADPELLRLREDVRYHRLMAQTAPPPDSSPTPP